MSDRQSGNSAAPLSTPELEEYAAASARRTAEKPDSAPPRVRRRVRTAAMIVAAAGLGALLVAAGYWLRGGPSPTPAEDSPEAGFARDMQVHHAQAVEMALTIRERTSDPEIRAVAYDIITSQQHQIGQMYAWLNAWGLPQSSDQRAMTWMAKDATDVGDDSMTDMPGMDAGTHDSMLLPDGRMPGMASPQDLARLSRLRGTQAEVLFLQLMIAHHEAGIDMAQAVLARSDRPEVVQLAGAIEQSQTAEIAAMRTMLETRAEPGGGTPGDDMDDSGNPTP